MGFGCCGHIRGAFPGRSKQLRWFPVFGKACAADNRIYPGGHNKKHGPHLTQRAHLLHKQIDVWRPSSRQQADLMSKWNNISRENALGAYIAAWSP